ncbi:MAG: GLUG motif-containing protein [Pseudomonadota bacterium]
MSSFYRISLLTILFLSVNMPAFADNSDQTNIIPIISLLLLNHSEAPVFAGGDGTSENPYQVATAEQLDKVRDHLDKHFIQTADIDLGASPWNDGEGWVPIGNFSDRFTGSFDGDGHSINNLKITRDEGNQALFAYMSAGSIIKKLRLIDIDVEGNYMVGALVAFQAGGDIINCHSTGTVKAYNNIGGLVGQSEGNITGCYTRGSVVGLANGNSHYYFGGLVGRLNGANITNCYSTAAITGDNWVGGLIGYIFTGTVATSYATGAVSGTNQLGGLIGKAETSSTISNSYWDINTSGQASSAGGTGKTTTEMQQQATYVDWDYSTVWGINPDENSAYPFLRWQGYTHVPLFNGGDGTLANPYQVATAGQLNNVRKYLDKHFIQTEEINLSAYADWEPIGDDSDRFSGSYNGNNKAITNLTITLTGVAYPIGLFGVSEGQIENAILTNTTINGHTAVGSLAGQNQIGATIANCSASGTITGVTYVGGLVGDNFGTITDSHAAISITGYNRLGGLVGFNETGGVISKSSSGGAVTGIDVYQEMMGGLIGYNNGLVEKSFTTADVTATYLTTGGLVGYNFLGIINNCYATGRVAGAHRVGGLVGDNRNQVNNSYSTGAVSGLTDLGGLVGLSAEGIGTDGIESGDYYDSQTSGMTDTGQGTPKTTAEMKLQSTYIDWDFSTVWEINTTDNDGYPFLR